jgi:hypothetical protein
MSDNHCVKRAIIGVANQEQARIVDLLAGLE